MRRRSIQARLLCCLGFVLLFVIAAPSYTWPTIGNAWNQVRVIVDSASRLDDSRQISVGTANMRSAMRETALFALQHNADQLSRERAAFASEAAVIRETVQRIQSADLSAEDRLCPGSARAPIRGLHVNSVLSL
jgi:hypothetical protein